MIFHSIYRLLIKKPALCVLLSILILPLSLAGLKNLSVETDYEIYFDGENTRLQQHREMEALYGRQDSVRIAVDFKASVFERKNIDIINAITERAWQIPYTSRVDSLTNYPYVQPLGDSIDINKMFYAVNSMDASSIEQRQRFVQQQDSIIGRLVSEDEHIGLINLLINLPANKNQANADIMQEIDNIRREYTQQYPEIDIYISGSIPINHAFFSAATQGMLKLLFAGLAILTLALAILYRSVIVCISVLVLMVLSVLSALGLGALVGIPVTAPTTSGLMVVLAMSIANAIHLVSRYVQQTALVNRRAIAVRRSLRKNVRPIILTCLTTVAGLLCLNFGQVPPYRNLGNTAALGVIANLFYTLTLLPPILRFAQCPKPKEGEGQAFFRLGMFVQKNRKNILIVFAVLVVFITPFIFKNTINDSLLSHFRDATPIKKESYFIMDNAGPIYQMSISLPAGEYDTIENPDYLRHLDNFVDWLRQQPKVMYVGSFIDEYKIIRQALVDVETEGMFPSSLEESAQTLLMYELSVPYGADLTNRIDIAKSASKVVVGVRNITSNDLRDLERQVNQWVSINLPHSMRGEPTGPNLLFAHIWRDATISNIYGLLIAIFIVALIVNLALKSPQLGALSIIPNALPIMLGFGLWGIFIGEVDISATVVAIILFGIVIDDTIHILSAYQAIPADKRDKPQALARLYQEIFPTLLVTSIGVTLAFSVLSLSNFDLNYKLGMVSCLIITIAYLFDLFVVIPLANAFRLKTQLGVSKSYEKTAL